MTNYMRMARRMKERGVTASEAERLARVWEGAVDALLDEYDEIPIWRFIKRQLWLGYAEAYEEAIEALFTVYPDIEWEWVA